MNYYFQLFTVRLGLRQGKCRPLFFFALLFLGVMMFLTLNLAYLEALAESSPPPSKPPVNISQQIIPTTTANLDIAVVFDTSGSMEFDTICYGCWARCGDSSSNTNAPLIQVTGGPACTIEDKYKPYPQNGWAFSFDYDSARMIDLRTGNNGLPGPVVTDTEYTSGPDVLTHAEYIIIEAEFYSHNSSIWQPEFRTPETGYWAIQRLYTSRAYAIDGYGYTGTPSGSGGQKLSGAVRHHPYLVNNSGNPFGRTYTRDDAQNDVSPRLEYDFYPTWSDNTYIYVRAQRYDNTDTYDDFYWSIDNWADTSASYPAHKEGGGDNNGKWQSSDNWSWVQLGPISVSADNMHTFKIWAGSVGYAIDRIFITNLDSYWVSLFQNQSATPGSAQRLATDPCNPIFGLTVTPTDCTYLSLTETTNWLEDALFDDIQPMRGDQEVVRELAQQLDPRLDQLGLVDFAGDGGQRAQLECKEASRARKAQAETMEDFTTQRANYPLDAIRYQEYDEFVCADPAEAEPGTVPISYTNFLLSLEDTNPSSGDTDVADGLRRGLHMLGINTDTDDGGNHANDCDWNHTSSWWRIRRNNGDWLNQPFGMDYKSNPVVSHCGRGQAAQPVVLLFSDGSPTNSNPGDNDNCITWNGEIPYQGFPVDDDKYKCVMYYTDIAAANNVPICAVGVGAGPDVELLQAIATRTNGAANVTFHPNLLDITAVLNSCLAGQGADIVLNKARIGTGNVTAGMSLTYTLRAENNGPITPVTTTLVDTWTPAEAIADVSAPGCDVNLAGGVLTCTISQLAVGQPVTLTTVLTTSPAYSGTFSNAAAITSTTGITDTQPLNNNTSSDPVTISGWPVLTLTKAGPASVQANEPITYTLTLANHSFWVVSGLVITDTIPAGATYLTGGQRVGDVVSWTISGLAINEVAIVTYTVTATRTITNSDYAVQTGGYHLAGTITVKTDVTAGNDNSPLIYLPLILK